MNTMRPALAAIVTALALLTASGCAVVSDQQGVGSYFDDTGTTTKVKAKLKGSKREKLADKLATSGKAKAKVETVATDEFDNQAVEEIKVRLREWADLRDRSTGIRAVGGGVAIGLGPDEPIDRVADRMVGFYDRALAGR